MGLMDKLKSEEPRIHKVDISIDQRGSVKRRTALLTTALLQVIRGTRLIDVIKSDYEHGHMVILVEAYNVTPPITPGEVHIQLEDWDGKWPPGSNGGPVAVQSA